VRLAGGYNTLIAVVPPAYNGTGTGLLPLAAGVLGASALSTSTRDEQLSVSRGKECPHIAPTDLARCYCEGMRNPLFPVGFSIAGPDMSVGATLGSCRSTD
jgi:hypothetical protein